MPSYNFICAVCNKPFEQFLSFSDFDKSKAENNIFIVDCPNCESMKATISYDEVPHTHVVNCNNVGVHLDKNAKKIGKVKAQEEQAKKEEALAPKSKPRWYGRLSKDKQQDIINPRKSKESRQQAAMKYIMTGE